MMLAVGDAKAEARANSLANLKQSTDVPQMEHRGRTNEIKGGGSNVRANVELSEDINVITAEINAYQRVAGEAIFEIGRRLHHVRYNPKEYGLPEGKDKYGNTIVARGAWGDWLAEVNIEESQSRRFITVFEEIGKRGTFHDSGLGLRALYEIATLPPEERDIPHELPTGETKKPDEMTVRELRELKRQPNKWLRMYL